MYFQYAYSGVNKEYFNLGFHRLSGVPYSNVRPELWKKVQDFKLQVFTMQNIFNICMFHMWEQSQQTEVNYQHIQH